MNRLLAFVVVAVLGGVSFADDSAASDAELKAQVKQLLENQKALMERLDTVEDELAAYKKAASRPSAPFGLPRSESISMMPAEPIGMQEGQAGQEPTGRRAKNGWYLSVAGGIQDRNRSREDFLTFIDWEDHGWQFHSAVGHRFNENFRLEIESGLMENDVDTLSANDGGGGQLIAPGSGSALVATLMMNLYLEYPVDITDEFTLVPYVGGGFGGLKSYLDDATNETVEPFGFVFQGDSKVALATQLIAGISYPITEHLEVFAHYRYVNADKLFFFIEDVPTPPAYVGPTDSEWNGGEFGIRWTF